MTKTIALQTAAFALSAFVTAGTFAAANTIATHQYVAATAVAMANTQTVAAQTVIVVAHHRANV